MTSESKHIYVIEPSQNNKYFIVKIWDNFNANIPSQLDVPWDRHLQGKPSKSIYMLENVEDVLLDKSVKKNLK